MSGEAGGAMSEQEALNMLRAESAIKRMESFSQNSFDTLGVTPGNQLRQLHAEATYALIQPLLALSARGKRVAEYLIEEIPSILQRQGAYVAKAKAARRSKIKSTMGYVYLVKSTTGHYKIGRTATPDNRLKTFSVKLPFEVEYICLIQTPNMYELEGGLHARYAAKRINGEWFALDDQDVEYIKGLAA